MAHGTLHQGRTPHPTSPATCLQHTRDQAAAIMHNAELRIRRAGGVVWLAPKSGLPTVSPTAASVHSLPPMPLCVPLQHNGTCHPKDQTAGTRAHP